MEIHSSRTGDATPEERFCDPRNSFYKLSLELLHKSGIPFLVGGAYALQHYTGIYRDTKDLDIFIHAADHERVLDIFSEAGFETSLTFTHWLAKAICNGHLVDIIFNSGNAISEVDEIWFAHAQEGKIFGVEVKIIPAEEMIWSKGFIMERERFDGADVNHILLSCAESLDWERLLARFGPHWRVLFSHLVLFGFVYPSERGRIPEWVMQDFMARMGKDSEAQPEKLCRGTLISRSQYRVDVTQGGFLDARLIPNGKMTKKQVQKWDAGAAIDGAFRRNNPGSG